MPVSAHVLESAAGTRLAAQLASGEIFAYAPVTDLSLIHIWMKTEMAMAGATRRYG